MGVLQILGGVEVLVCVWRMVGGLVPLCGGARGCQS